MFLSVNLHRPLGVSAISFLTFIIDLGSYGLPSGQVEINSDLLSNLSLGVT